MPLLITNPFYKFPLLESKKLAKKRKPFYPPIVTLFAGFGCFLACAWTIYVVYLQLFFSTDVMIFLFITALSIVMVLIYTGGYLAVKISTILGKMRTVGMYDLIMITPQGDQFMTWLIGRTVYKKIKWIKDARIIARNTAFLFLGLLMVQLIVNGIRAITARDTPAYEFRFWQSTVQVMIDFIFLVIPLWLYAVQGVVMGYLLAIWGNNLITTRFNRMTATIGAFLGNQFLLYVIAYIVLLNGLPDLYDAMDWATSTLILIQIVGLACLHECSVRVTLRVLARQAELPYALWRSEIGV
ncbi:MAG TPA: hypothetical protein PLZ51_08100 [Aggregatilineales bacterium]|nr:hypothetical protein [Aggregatilineales bacterium]